MPVEITNVTNQQELEVHVSGPGSANRMFIVSGIGSVSLYANAAAGSSATAQETFTTLVGPTLTSAQFVEALATAAPSAVQVWSGDPPNSNVMWRVTDVDADFDDESARTRLRIEARIDVSGVQVQMQSISFQATIVAAL
jgi:hypothetical protein